MSECERCRKRGKTWPGDDPRCAFLGDGVFRAKNWNCATLNELRDWADIQETVVWSNDQNAAVVTAPRAGWHVVLGWYKRRGSTEWAGVLRESSMTPLRIDEAEAMLRMLESGGR